MKFKLIEKLDYNEFSESILSQYLYDAVDELENASLERYIDWFRKEIPEIDQPDEDLFITCVRDAYIQLIDYGEIVQPKTMITSQLKDYIESHKDIIDDTDELMRQCPEHLQHELKLVVDAANLNESLLEELPSSFKQMLYDFIKQNHNLLNNNIDELYLLCPVGLKRDLADLLKSANIKVNTELINKFEFLVGKYNPQDLDRIVIDHEGQPGTTTANVEYIIRNWNKFDFPEYKELNEEVLTEETLTNIENTAFAGTGCIITVDPHKKFYLVRTPLNNTYCIPVIQQNMRSSNDYNKRRYKSNGTVVNGNLVDSSGTTLGPAYYGVPTNHNHYDYDDINLYQYSKYLAANGAGQTLSAFVQDVKSGKV